MVTVVCMWLATHVWNVPTSAIIVTSNKNQLESVAAANSAAQCVCAEVYAAY